MWWLLWPVLAVDAIEVSVAPQGVSLLQHLHTITETLELEPSQILAYYINTKEEEGRRQHMEDQARAAHLPLLRFEAIGREQINSGRFDQKYVLAQKLSRELMNPNRQKDHVVNATIACYVSHNELLEKMQRMLQPHQIGLVLEDDVEIPHNWKELIENTLACAPSDWSLLKVSGWGYSRPSDLQSKPDHQGVLNETGMALLSWLQSQGGWMSRILYGAPTRKGTIRRNITERHQLLQIAAQAFSGEAKEALMLELQKSLAAEAPGAQEMPEAQEAEESEECPDAYLMKRPFKETFWWHFWGPAFHYAGTGAYLVKASSIPAVLAHLRKQRINDIDGMLLSEGDLRAYELWPHIFPLTGDHMKSTMLHDKRKAGLLDTLSHIFPGDSEVSEPGQVNTSRESRLVRSEQPT